jgi:hypothetical protein
MSHFIEEQFTKLGKTREQCIEFLSMHKERLDQYKTFDDLHNRIYGYKYANKEAVLLQRQEEALVSHRHSNHHEKWYRVIKTLLRSTGLVNLNDTMSKLMMESCKRKNERVTDANGVTTIIKSSAPVVYDPPAIFPIYKYSINEIIVGDQGDYKDLGIFYEGAIIPSKVLQINKDVKIKHKILIQNVFYARKHDKDNVYKSIPHSEKELHYGLMVRIEFDDIRELKGTPVIIKIDIIFIPLESYTSITNSVSILPKTDEPESKREKQFVKELNDKAKKISKASLPSKEHTKQNILPRFH